MYDNTVIILKTRRQSTQANFIPFLFLNFISIAAASNLKFNSEMKLRMNGLVVLAACFLLIWSYGFWFDGWIPNSVWIHQSKTGKTRTESKPGKTSHCISYKFRPDLQSHLRKERKSEERNSVNWIQLQFDFINFSFINNGGWMNDQKAANEWNLNWINLNWMELVWLVRMTAAGMNFKLSLNDEWGIKN